ncbi:MAG: hypothetical protein NVS1B3_10750 [Candidatus Dormibacteraceae bacterium]
MRSEVKRRTYSSEGRRKRAEAKRLEILEIARDLFLQHGYRATTMEAIAQKAEVAAETVYAAFGNKSKLFTRVIDIAVVGDAREVPLLQREWVGQIKAEPDPRVRLLRLTELSASVLARVGPLHSLVRAVMEGDPEVAAIKLRQDELRYQGQLEFVRLLDGSLRPGLTLETARDIYWTVASPEVHHLLTIDRKWTRKRYQEWLMSVLEPALLK